MSRGHLRAAPASPLRRLGSRLARPTTTVESMRWLFAVTAVASLLLVLPAPASVRVPGAAALTAVGTTVLIGSWLTGYFLRRGPVWLDVLDAVGLACVGATCPEPTAVFSFAFPGLWFRALYGSTTQAALRCAVYGTGICAGALWWPSVAGQGAPAAIGPVLGTMPVVFLVVITGRLLAACLFSREEAAGRDAALASAGEVMLSLDDPERIVAQAGATSTQICAATPGLRMLAVLPRPDGTLLVQGTAGPFAGAPAELPDVLPGAVVGPTAGHDSATGDTAPLDALVGRRCAWLAVPMPAHPEGGWMLVGAPGRVPEEAVLAVRSLVNQVALALRNSDTRRALARRAHTDGLTGLLNRTAFAEALEEALLEERGTLSLLFVDLDDFKPVNDEHGHAAGDALLVEVAARLSRLVPAGSTCARLGGDEFAVLLRGLDREDSARTGRDLVRALRRPVLLEDAVVRIGASVGIAATGAGGVDGTSARLSAAQLTRAADAAMYRAKSTGKDAVATAWEHDDPAPGAPAAALGGRVRLSR
ncbi:diguanylate cyclase domain-containing protein [Kineococcus sp. SYSU DK004]|uniref:diguanylate cyclase domain-containing protein n=1 Tax=Kineococcus sp. SYSU DK004 TaxID=3383125 RepID=UPI003D7C4428